jgi:hypothetical protein
MVALITVVSLLLAASQGEYSKFFITLVRNSRFYSLATALSPTETILRLARRQVASGIDPSEFPTACQSGCTSSLNAIGVSIASGVHVLIPEFTISVSSGLLKFNLRLHIFKPQRRPILYQLSREYRHLAAVCGPECLGQSVILVPHTFRILAHRYFVQLTIPNVRERVFLPSRLVVQLALVLQALAALVAAAAGKAAVAAGQVA